MVKSLRLLSSLSSLLTLTPHSACPLWGLKLIYHQQTQPPSRIFYFKEQNHHRTRCRAQKYCSPWHSPLFHHLYLIHCQHGSVSPPQDKHTRNKCTPSSDWPPSPQPKLPVFSPRRPLLIAPWLLCPYSPEASILSEQSSLKEDLIILPPFSGVPLFLG